MPVVPDGQPLRHVLAGDRVAVTVGVALVPGGRREQRLPHGRPGHPVVLGRTHWAGVSRDAVGDVGARPYLTAHRTEVTRVACEDVADGDDVDRPAGSGA